MVKGRRAPNPSPAGALSRHEPGSTAATRRRGRRGLGVASGLGRGLDSFKTWGTHSPDEPNWTNTSLWREDAPHAGISGGRPLGRLQVVSRVAVPKKSSPVVVA